MTTLHLVKMTDTAFPPRGELAPKGAHIVAGYIGGDTPHIWTPKEWASFGKMRKLPIFVRSNRGSADQGKKDGYAALAALHELHVPRGTTVAYDLEILIAARMVGDFYNILRWGGYYVWPYGSADYLFKNPSCSGYWVADYTDQPFEYPHSRVAATQYAPDQSGWDWSEVKGWQVARRIKEW